MLEMLVESLQALGASPSVFMREKLMSEGSEFLVDIFEKNSILEDGHSGDKDQDALLNESDERKFLIGLHAALDVYCAMFGSGLLKPKGLFKTVESSQRP